MLDKQVFCDNFRIVFFRTQLNILLFADFSLSSPTDTDKGFLESEEPETLEGVHLMFDSEAADLLPMVVR